MLSQVEKLGVLIESFLSSYLLSHLLFLSSPIFYETLTSHGKISPYVPLCSLKLKGNIYFVDFSTSSLKNGFKKLGFVGVE
jgi:hypothetical protein